MNILIPMAGLGTRFTNEGIKTPKPLIKVNDKTLIEHSVKSLNIYGNYIFITRKYDNPDDNIELSKELKRLVPNSTEICISHATKGSTETCLLAEHLIDNDEPLIITNCDQLTSWNSVDFLNSVENYDGAVVTYTSDNPKNSFAILDENGLVTKMVEKKVVSNVALIGVHYWKKGNFFVNSAKELMKNFECDGIIEPYISETYNFLIKNNHKIKTFHIEQDQYISLGTPYDIVVYQSRIKEYFTDKPKTIFCDLDGTILHHVHRFSDVVKETPKLLDLVCYSKNRH